MRKKKFITIFPNGKNIIKITTNAKQIESYPDARELYIKFENMESKIQWLNKTKED